MYLASLSSTPSELVRLTRSDPARSTRFSLALRTKSDPSCMM